MARPIMIQGTMSNVGKSILTGALCRIFHQDGLRTAPFKSQNMALNSYITRDGLEIGRAQAMQAQAAGIEPDVSMNPILLKPTNDMGSQVIIKGKPEGVLPAVEYYRRKKEFIPVVMEAYDKLSQAYDVIVIEGAGSPAEINLKQDDIVNMGLAEMVDAPVLLAGDIDRGGVFAQIAGTVMLLEESERRRIKGTIINKFRGDLSILTPGLVMIEEKTDIPVLGVVPYFDLDIDDEDSLSDRFARKKTGGLADIAVIRLPRISNFTDIAPLEASSYLNVRYVSSPSEFGSPDAVIIPGTKNTIGDLLWMRQNGLEGKIVRFASRRGLVFGICGGYQMLGREISDPCKVEQGGTVRGMGLLPVCTVFGEEKRRTRVSGRVAHLDGILSPMSGAAVEGYEIHMGSSCVKGTENPLVSLKEENGADQTQFTDGTQEGNVYGCYIHGIFDSPEVSEGFISSILKDKGFDLKSLHMQGWKEYREEQYDRLADIVRNSLDMDAVYRILDGK